MPEHLDTGINNGDDSFETWVSAESESDNTIDETWVSAESECNNTSGDLMETSQSCVVTGSIPGFLGTSSYLFDKQKIECLSDTI